MASSDAGQYEKFREKFRFRNKAALRIPFQSDGIILARNACYKLAVDIVIESVTKRQYRNFKSIPYHGFYGYASLVFADCLDRKIELEFGRNRVYEERISEAFTAWNSLAFYLNTEKKFLETLFANSGGGGSTVNICDVPAFSVSCSPLSLTELYVNCPENTQFYIELSWIQPKPFTDNCGKLHNGKTQEPEDEDKEGGVPPDGSQPKLNPPNNPWRRNQPPTVLPPNSPYRNDKIDKIDDSNLDNDVDEDLKRWAFVQGQYKDFAQGCQTLYFGLTFEMSLDDDSLTPYVSPPFPITDSCGGQLVVAELRGDNTGTVYVTTGGDGAYVTNIVDALENPFQGYAPTLTPPQN